MLVISIIEFLLFSLIGWLLDSGYRSYIDKKWVNAGYFKGPICPIYGFGALTLIFIFKQLEFLPLFFLIIFGTIALILVEYLGGIFAEKVLKIKLWDYSISKYHLGGHIDLLHSFFWLVLVLVFSFSIYPATIYFEKMINIPELLEVPTFIFFVLGSLWLTIRKEPTRYLEIKEKFANIPLSEYQKIFSNIKKMQRAKSEEARRNLLRLVKKQLKNSGAYLKRFNKYK